VAARAWVLAWEALNAYSTGETAQTRRLVATQEALETVGVEAPVPGATDGDTRWSLRSEGGDTVLEEAEWQLLKTAIADLRKRRDNQGNPVLMGVHAAPLVWLDELLEDPPTHARTAS
jgi:hypothetical protein